MRKRVIWSGTEKILYFHIITEAVDKMTSENSASSYSLSGSESLVSTETVSLVSTTQWNLGFDKFMKGRRKNKSSLGNLLAYAATSLTFVRMVISCDSCSWLFSSASLARNSSILSCSGKELFFTFVYYIQKIKKSFSSSSYSGLNLLLSSFRGQFF